MIKPRIVLLIFVSGKVVLTGAKVRAEIYESFENIYPILNGFRKMTQWLLCIPSSPTQLGFCFFNNKSVLVHLCGGVVNGPDLVRRWTLSCGSQQQAKLSCMCPLRRPGRSPLQRTPSVSSVAHMVLLFGQHCPFIYV